MAVNRNWVKTDGVRLEFAPTWLNTDAGLVINPSEDQYRADGWLQNGVEQPAPPDGQMVAATRYEARDGRVVAVYDYAQAPKTPRVFSKLYLIIALQKRGLYERFKDTLETFSLTDLWIAANEISEAFTGFDDYIKVVKADLGLTDAQVEEILAEAVAR